MDNITHSLAGLLLAEGAVQLRRRTTGREPLPRFRAIAALTSMVAANLPDADLLYTGVGADRLAYMLQHRGYTHTVPGVIVGALVMWGVAWLVWRWRAHAAPPRDDARWLLALLLVSTASHLVLDWTNSYGVHPFWPIDDRWRYGDSVFIVEPWLWVVSVPALVAATASRVGRVLLLAVLAIGVALVWRVSLVSRGAATMLTLGAAISVALALALAPRARVATAVGAWVAVTLVMAAGSAAARASTVRAVHAADPAAELLDVVVSPTPTNAVCMSVLTVERTGATYRVVTGRASAVPGLTPASRCGSRGGNGGGWRASSRLSTASVRWDGEWSAPAADLATLAHQSCRALAALRFIRAPIWLPAGDSALMLGDARYGGASGNGFASVRVALHDARCPRAVPPWIPPRRNLL